MASGNCWFVASGNWWQLCRIFRMEFPVGVLNTPNFYFQVYAFEFDDFLCLCNAILIATRNTYTNNYTNSHLHTLSSTQKMRTNGTVVTEILDFKNIMLNTGIGFQTLLL